MFLTVNKSFDVVYIRIHKPVKLKQMFDTVIKKVFRSISLCEEREENC